MQTELRIVQNMAAPTSSEASTSSQARNGLSRLVEKQEEEIDIILKRIELWNKYQDDYQKLKGLIDSMQDKVRHPHRIPVAGTQLAFLPGHIIHTNEINVLLGDNYFALRSARQAGKIIDRRLDNIRETLKSNQEAKRQAEEWLKAARVHKQDKEEFVEIIETM